MTLDEVLKKYAYRRCVVTLSAGGTSDEYVDVKAALLIPPAAEVITEAACDYCGLGLAVPPQVDAFAGVELGGALFALAVGLATLTATLVVRKEVRGHGLPDEVLGLEMARAAYLPGHVLRIWLLEDVVTSGASTVRALEKLRQLSDLDVVGVLAVCDRGAGGLEQIQRRLPDRPVLALTTLDRVRAANGEAVSRGE